VADEAEKLENDLIAGGLNAEADKIAHMREHLANPETSGADLVADDAKAAHELAASLKDSHPDLAAKMEAMANSLDDSDVVWIVINNCEEGFLGCNCKWVVSRPWLEDDGYFYVYWSWVSIRPITAGSELCNAYWGKRSKFPPCWDEKEGQAPGADILRRRLAQRRGGMMARRLPKHAAVEEKQWRQTNRLHDADAWLREETKELHAIALAKKVTPALSRPAWPKLHLLYCIELAFAGVDWLADDSMAAGASKNFESKSQKVASADQGPGSCSCDN
jgi:hypothetical protein